MGQICKGSQKWIRELVNQRPCLLDCSVHKQCNLASGDAIEWVSPLAKDRYKECGVAAFLKKLGIQLKCKPLDEFWPAQGPKWDALGHVGKDTVFLVEAKARIREFAYSKSDASDCDSKKSIAKSLDDVKNFLGVKTGSDWSKKYYQYANRIAHLYLLRELNQVPAYLLFIYFVGDEDVCGPQDEKEWKAAIVKAKSVLGLPPKHHLSDYIVDIFIHVDDLKTTTSQTGTKTNSCC